jgi:hypothetical protein
MVHAAPNASRDLEDETRRGFLRAGSSIIKAGCTASFTLSAWRAIDGTGLTAPKQPY